MLDFLEQVKDLWSVYGAWVVLLCAIVVEYKWRPLRRVYKVIEILEQNAKLHDELTEHVERVQTELLSKMDSLHSFVLKELSYNGQSSTKDAIARTEKLVAKIAAQTHVGMELHPYGIFMCDPSGKIFFVNRSFAYLCETTKEELHDYGWQNFFPDSQHIEQTLRSFQKRKETSIRTELTSRSGATKEVQIVTTVLQGIEGHMGYVIPTHYDHSLYAAA